VLDKYLCKINPRSSCNRISKLVSAVDLSFASQYSRHPVKGAAQMALLIAVSVVVWVYQSNRLHSWPPMIRLNTATMFAWVALGWRMKKEVVQTSISVVPERIAAINFPHGIITLLPFHVTKSPILQSISPTNNNPLIDFASQTPEYKEGKVLVTLSTQSPRDPSKTRAYS
jgi:hypothetical protein